MRIGTLQKRALLTKAYSDAVGASPQITLRAELEARSNAASALVYGGQQVESASGNGRSMTFATGQGAVQATDTMNAYQELLLLLDQVETDSTTLTTDLQKKNEMLGRLVPATESRNNFSTFRHYR